MALEIFHKMPHIRALAHAEIELGRVGFKIGRSDTVEVVQKAIKTLKQIRERSGYCVWDRSTWTDLPLERSA